MSRSRALSALALMMTTVMVVMDMTIVNVTLPHMMGALGASADQVTWVLTAYIVAEAVTIPLTGWLAGMFGRRRMLLGGIGGFVLASGLCGLSTSLSEIVVFRLVQGVFGAPLIPLSQAILVDQYPADQRNKAMAIWGIGMMLGPVLGPTVGGLVTDHMNWRWVFYINLPVGMLSLLLIARTVQASERRMVGTDWVGALWMIVGVGSLQTMLDRGNQEGWWDSGLIDALTVAAVVGLALFVYRSLTCDSPIVKLRLFADRNLAVASAMMLVFGLGLFGTVALQPIMLESLLHYPAETTGLVMAPRAIGAAISMGIAARVGARTDPRLLVGVGMILTATGTWIMSTYSLDISPAWVIWPGFVQGLGMGGIFVSLSSMAYGSVDPKYADDAAGLFNLARTIGSAMGVSIAATWYTRFTQANWHQLGGYVTPFNPAYHAWLNAHGMTPADPLTPALLGAEVARQASMLAFTQVFTLIAASFLLLAPLLLFMRRPERSSTPAAHG